MSECRHDSAGSRYLKNMPERGYYYEETCGDCGATRHAQWSEWTKPEPPKCYCNKPMIRLDSGRYICCSTRHKLEVNDSAELERLKTIVWNEAIEAAALILEQHGFRIQGGPGYVRFLLKPEGKP